MKRIENEASNLVSYLIEHGHGTSEVWFRRIDEGDIYVFQPIRIVELSGSGPESMNPQQVTESIALEEWMADHFQVFSEGRTSPDREK